MIKVVIGLVICTLVFMIGDMVPGSPSHDPEKWADLDF